MENFLGALVGIYWEMVKKTMNVREKGEKTKERIVKSFLNKKSKKFPFIPIARSYSKKLTAVKMMRRAHRADDALLSNANDKGGARELSSITSHRSTSPPTVH